MRFVPATCGVSERTDFRLPLEDVEDRYLCIFASIESDMTSSLGDTLRVVLSFVGLPMRVSVRVVRDESLSCKDIRTCNCEGVTADNL